MQDDTRKKWFYPPLPKAMRAEIERILDKHGGELAIYTVNEFVRTAVREKIASIKEGESAD